MHMVNQERSFDSINKNHIMSALHLIEKGKLKEASHIIQQQFKDVLDSPEVVYLQGKLAFNQQDFKKSLQLLEQAQTSIAPQYKKDLLFMLGFIARDQGRIDEAVDYFKQLLRLDSSDLDSLRQLGHIYFGLGQLQLALDYYLKILNIDSNDVNALNNIGVIYLHQQNYAKAIEYYTQALSINAHDYHVLKNMGLVYQLKEQYAEALEFYQQIISNKSNDDEFFNNVAIVYYHLGDYEKAIEFYKKAINIKAESSYFNNIAACYKALHQYDMSLSYYNKALADDLENPDYLKCIGSVYKDKLDFDKAIVFYNSALSLRKDFKQCQFSKSLVQLTKGDFRLGWKNYCARYSLDWFNKTKQLMDTFPPSKSWNGKDTIAGKKLFVILEQGYGDVIQFCRYATILKGLGAEVISNVPPILSSLLDDIFPSDNQYETNMAIDYYVPLLSLPYLLETTIETIPMSLPYLIADGQKVEEYRRYIDTDKVKVGLVWSGNPNHVNDRNRSIKLLELTPLLDVKNTQFYSFQLDDRKNDINELKTTYTNIIDLSSHIQDFSDTAALLSHMDLLISVDTAIVHVAGAMNKRCWVLLSNDADWRWLTQRRDSVWYYSVLLYRQNEAGLWLDVVQSMAKNLMQLSRTVQ